MIEVVNLKKVYVNKKRKYLFLSEKETKEAVNNINMKIKPGEVTGLLGINGAGKTTTIKILATLLKPTSGKVLIDGIDAVKDASKVKPFINMIAGGERMLYFRLTGKQNLEYFGSLYGLKGNLLKERIYQVLEKLELTAVAETPVERYSKGMKQRLQIARGLINDPKYLFLDEPTLGLDISVAKRLREYIKELAYKENKGILLTSHYLTEVEELCNHVYVLNNGEVLVQDTPQNLISTFLKGNTLTVYLSKVTDSLQQEFKLLAHKNNATYTFNQEKESVSFTCKDDITSTVIQTVNKFDANLISLNIDSPNLEDAIESIHYHLLEKREWA